MIRLTRTSTSMLEASGAARERALARAPQAEWGLAHQGARVILSRDQESGWLVRPAGRHLVALGLPLGRPDLRGLSRTAAGRTRLPLLYKCDGRTALAAQRAGWSVVRIGHEAVLDLGGWTPERPACRQLRRKLRVAVALRVEQACELPLEAMEAVSRDWVRRQGGERGFSMGRFDPALLRRQRVLLAWSEEGLLGFASFHAARDEWTLDLMRQVEGAPDGTMHRLVTEAVALAREAGAKRLSLAGVLDLPEDRPWLRRVTSRAQGLVQFKGSFGPRLSPRYAAAPGPAALALGLAAVGWAVHRPGPLGRDLPSPGRRAARPGPNRSVPQFGFEPAPIPCDARRHDNRPAAALPPGPPAPYQRP
jgi:phosphatidylglycerol lysyltransferase